MQRERNGLFASHELPPLPSVCPLDGLKPVDSNYEIVHRGDCDCDFKPSATRHPTRHRESDTLCRTRGKSFPNTMRYTRDSSNNVGRNPGREISRTRYFTCCIVPQMQIRDILWRIYYFVCRDTWHFYTDTRPIKNIPISVKILAYAIWGFRWFLEIFTHPA